MLTRINTLWTKYPPQFWLIFFGRFLATSGVSMVWPFLLLFVSKQLELPLTQVATLMTINAIAGIGASLIAGPLVDRIGRKWIMVPSLFINAVTYLLMTSAETYSAFAGLMVLSGTVNPLYRVGADAMLADLIDSQDRAEAYALIRWSNNLGVAMGPTIGGYLAVISYSLTFKYAASGLSIYGLLLLFLAHETLLALPPTTTKQKVHEHLGGYAHVFQDTTYLGTVSLIALGLITAALMWIILPVYASQQFNIPENQYGLIPSTNALMVVLFQITITKFTKRYRPLHMMALGMFFYAIGTGLVSLSNGFWGFWLSMVIMTFGELILAPTSSTYVANIAPADMRGRYMSIYNLMQRLARGTGPVLGGWLSDAVHPRATWIGGLVAGLTSALGLSLLSKRNKIKITTNN